jgi:WD40 repeat protein
VGDGVDTILVYGKQVLAGSRDGLISVFGVDLDKSGNDLNLAELEELKNSRSLKPRAIALNKEGTQMAVGTFGCEVVNFRVNQVETKLNFYEPTIVTEGHWAPSSTSTNEIWGLAWNSNNIFATAGDDSSVRFFDFEKKEQKSDSKFLFNHKEKDKKAKAGTMARAVAFSDYHCAVGLKENGFKLYSTN